MPVGTSDATARAVMGQPGRISPVNGDRWLLVQAVLGLIVIWQLVAVYSELVASAALAAGNTALAVL